MSSPWWLVTAIAFASATIRFLVALHVRTPLYYPDEYLYSALARSFAETGLPRIRGSFVSFTPLLGPLLMSPAWLIRNTELAYRVSQACAAVAFSATAFPAFALGRRLGVSVRGSLAAVVLLLVIPDGVYSATLMSEPYAYPLFVTAVLVCVQALATPSIRWQLMVVGVTLALGLVRLQFAVFLVAYLGAAWVTARGSPLALVRRQIVVVAAAGIAVFGVLAIGAARAAGEYRGITDFRYPPVETTKWFAVAVFTTVLAAGWVMLPGAVLGLVELARSQTTRHRAFAWLSVLLVVGLALEAAVFGVNEGRAIERYTFYAVPLVAIACVWWIESGAPRRRAYRAVAYLGAATMVVLPAWQELRSAVVDQAPVLIGLGRLHVGDHPAALVWSPLLAIAGLVTAWIGSNHPRVLLVGAIVIGIATSAASSAWFIRSSRHAVIPRVTVPHGAAVLAWAGSDPYYLMKTLFWNRNITRVLILGGGHAPDGFPAIEANLVPRMGLVGSDRERLPGPYVALPDTVVDRARTPDPVALRRFDGVPQVIAVGWRRTVGYLGTSTRLLIAPARGPLRVTLGLWSPRRHETIRWQCNGDPGRSVRLGHRVTTISILTRAGSRWDCRLSLVRGVPTIVGGQLVGIRATLRAEQAG
jgi:hypothetical protein